MRRSGAETQKLGKAEYKQAYALDGIPSLSCLIHIVWEIRPDSQQNQLSGSNFVLGGGNWTLPGKVSAHSPAVFPRREPHIFLKEVTEIGHIIVTAELRHLGDWERVREQ